MHKMNGQTVSKRVGGLAEAKSKLKTGTGVLERMSSPATFSVPSQRGHLVNEPEAPLLTVSPTGSASRCVNFQAEQCPWFSSQWTR